jgi:methylmalonyl-CoA/ethylmalonyl-CoA epimerase
MGTNILGTNLITQIGILVHDIEKDFSSVCSFLRHGKASVVSQRCDRQCANRIQGEAFRSQSEAGLFDMGSLQLELIEPDHNPSIWRELLDKNGECPHHIAFVIKAIKEKIAFLQCHQMPLLQKGEYTDGRYAYIDTLRDLKVIVELLENES